MQEKYLMFEYNKNLIKYTLYIYHHTVSGPENLKKVQAKKIMN